MTGESGAATPYAPAPDGALVLYRGATLFDGTGGPARPGMSVLTAGETVLAVGDDADVAAALAEGIEGVEDGAHPEVVDLSGRFVVPGLIDSHQHLATPPDRPAAEAVLRRLVHSGVTAIRDMADDLRHVADLARGTRVGEIPGPDIHYAALMAGPSFFDDPRTHQVTRGAVAGRTPWMRAITPDTDLPLAVAEARGTFATAVKIYADLDAGAVAAITAEAHRQGLEVWAHAAVFPAGPGEVVAAGADAISHVTLLAFEGAARPLTTYRDKPPVEHERFAGGDDPHLAALFAEMKRRGTVLDATAGMWTSEELSGESAEDAERARLNTELSAAVTAQAHRAGVAVCTGTDYETSPDAPFPALHDELSFLVNRCGMAPAAALHAATLVGARAAGAEDVMGSVEPGKLANFAVLAKDPLADIENLRTVTLTVKRGRRFVRADFDRDRASGAAPAGASPMKENR